MTEDEIQLRSIEAFLRRASQVDMPFMAKGSIITRQYLDRPEIRKVADLDWVYLNFLDTNEEAESVFSEWTTAITEIELDDNVKFRSFADNKFWRSIDYAMNDDFPTVNTDLECKVKGILNDRLGLDISFNLDVDSPPVEIMYNPIEGESFRLKYTTPYSTQIAWKMHQLLVRPRMKDIFDLIHLFENPLYSTKIFSEVVYSLCKECLRDNIEIDRLLWYVDDRLIEYHRLEESGNMNSSLWTKLNNTISPDLYLDSLSVNWSIHFTSPEYFNFKSVSDALVHLKSALLAKGFTEKNIKIMVLNS